MSINKHLFMITVGADTLNELHPHPKHTIRQTCSIATSKARKGRSKDVVVDDDALLYEFMHRSKRSKKH